MENPRGPYDPFPSGKLCNCEDCKKYRRTYTKEEWLKEIENGS